MGKLWDFFTRNEGKDVEVTPDALKKEITELGYNGDANAYMRIFEANRPMLKDPDLIYPGQALRIPT